MKPMKAKAKNKKNNAKFARVKLATKDNVAIHNPDFTNLRKPVDTSVSNLSQVSKLLETGSDEVKALLTYECDIIYECRVCHSLYRSLVNFISHKRVYCKEKFNVTLNKALSHDYEMIFNKESLPSIQAPEQTVFKDNSHNDRILRSHAPRVENRKDLTAIIDMLQKKQQESSTDKLRDFTVPNGASGYAAIKGQLCLESVGSNKSAVYQTSIDPLDTGSGPDLMKAQVLEMENMKKHDTIKLGRDKQQLGNNQSEQSDSPLQIYGSDEDVESVARTQPVKNLMCSMCNVIFATKKTLAVHVKTLHTLHRMCYPCPCCPSIFTNTWSVYRHLFKVHRKSNEQVRKLRSQIQETAFRKETTTAEDLEKETQIPNYSVSRNLLRVNETQEWMDHLESDSELQRCGGCGKRFDRRAALASHFQYCQRRIAAFNDSNGSNKAKKSSKVQPDLGMDSKATQNEVDTPTIINTRRTAPQNTSNVSQLNETNEISIRVQAVSTLSKADWDKIDSGQPLSSDFTEVDMLSISTNSADSSDVDLESTNKREDSSPSSDVSDVPEIIFTKLDNFVTASPTESAVPLKENDVIAVNGGCKRRKLSSGGKVTPQMEKLEKPMVTNVMKTNIPILNLSKLPIRKKDQSAMMENKIAAIANLRKLQCVPCKRKFTSMTNLRRHIAIHIGWNRYSCKLCNFKCFVKCDCVAHCNKMHNAQNNRALIAEMVFEIPPDQYTCNEDIVMDITNLEDSVPEQTTVSRTVSTVQDSAAALTGAISGTENGKPASTNFESPDAYVIQGGKTVEEESAVILKKKNIESDEFQMTEVNTDEDTSKENDQDCVLSVSTNSQSGRLDSDPDLRRMVMEVIFGSTDISPQKAIEQERTRTDNNNVSSEKKPLDGGENLRIPNGRNDSKEFRPSLGQEESKPQRPVRNRVKPVKKDFIYDLKEVLFRKEIVAPKTTFAANKVLLKKPFVRLYHSECNTDIRESNSPKDNKNVGKTLLASCENGGIKETLDVTDTKLNSSCKLSEIERVQQPELAEHTEK